ncbi:hypothetical protein PAXRUDRAFT_825761 [Paxillus rubicundulus Ve08.2h10]|uniref:Secreted protein n=1 Tax=Paxillus rubicundulus Ve08.2h10 TaxID=930991 RepID=A0A0D0E078_9AGAM|nr:hypothetical protein PAXRUDRAFT_825761 [Paxillus rubicundulus Ve08.2h10]
MKEAVWYSLRLVGVFHLAAARCGCLYPSPMKSPRGPQRLEMSLITTVSNLNPWTVVGSDNAARVTLPAESLDCDRR